MPWLVKALLLAMKTKQGRRLLLAGGTGAAELARSERARQFYGRAWDATAGPRPRQKAARLVRSAADKIKR